MEITLYVRRANTELVMEKYRYQWMNEDRTQLRRRWDDAPHYPDLANFPHHCHVGSEETVESSQEMDIQTLLDFIQAELTQP